ncbi:hypothetical protein BJX65DRAFT_265403 [Aspergillus insuetus]
MSANQYYNQGPPGPQHPQAAYVLSASFGFSGSICCACGEPGREPGRDVKATVAVEGIRRLDSDRLNRLHLASSGRTNPGPIFSNLSLADILTSFCVLQIPRSAAGLSSESTWPRLPSTKLPPTELSPAARVSSASRLGAGAWSTPTAISSSARTTADDVRATRAGTTTETREEGSRLSSSLVRSITSANHACHVCH